MLSMELCGTATHWFQMPVPYTLKVDVLSPGDPGKRDTYLTRRVSAAIRILCFNFQTEDKVSPRDPLKWSLT